MNRSPSPRRASALAASNDTHNFKTDIVGPRGLILAFIIMRIVYRIFEL